MMTKRNWDRVRAERHVQAGNRRVQEEGAGFKVLAQRGCWCGQKLHHDWPGKDEGAPHPRQEGNA